MPLLNANSYEKGGWVLHMLRRKLGEEAFWHGIRTYYAQYDGRNAYTDDLRHVMEQAGEQNLELFFKQWLFTAGNPQLGITWKYDAAKGVVDVHIEQKQNTLFAFPLEVSVGGKLHSIIIKDKNTAVQFPVKAKPLVIVDPNVNLLAGFEVMEGN